jgi:hypothetical protein
MAGVLLAFKGQFEFEAETGQESARLSFTL